METTLSDFESCPSCGVMINKQALQRTLDYDSKEEKTYFEDNNYTWIFCPICREKKFTVCND